MKKTMVALLVMAMFLFSFNVFAQAQSSWSVKAGLDFGSEMDIEDETYDTTMGYTIIGEYKMPYSNSFNVGAGLAYQLDRELEVEEETGENADFGFTPFYGLAEYRMQDSPLYFVGHLGFATLSVDHPDVEESSGGFYYALGAGMDISDSYVADILYTNNSGEVEFAESEEASEVDYSKITVTFGMRF
jgi:hypothetical protein